MRGNNFRKSVRPDKLSFLWLLLAAVLMVFSNGRWIIPLAAWLAPVFMIRFLRTSKAATGLVCGALVSVAAGMISFYAMIPVPGMVYYPVAGSIALLFFVPFVVDRLLANKVGGFLSTLVFPLAFTSLEYANSLVSPYSTWGALAYTQYGNLPLMQITAVTGIWGTTFLITWFAALVNQAWQEGFDWGKIKKGVLGYVTVGLLLALIGGARLALFTPQRETVRVASITVSTPNLSRTSIATQTEEETLRRQTLQIQKDLLALSQQAATGEARIVFWQETAAPVFEEDYTEFLNQATETARKQNIYLLIAVSVRPRDYPGQPLENKTVLIDPSGEVKWSFLKARPAPREGVVRGDGVISFSDTPFGRIASVICFDMDFPRLIRQAGAARVDLMLVPSRDWKAISPYHTHMAVFRAIENGFSMVRSAGSGLSAAVDYQGRVLNSKNFLTSNQKIMYADVPTKGVATIYAKIGDVFAWLCIGGFISILIYIGGKKRGK